MVVQRFSVPGSHDILVSYNSNHNYCDFREARNAKFQQEKAEKEEALRKRQQEKLQKEAEEAARIAAANRYTK